MSVRSPRRWIDRLVRWTLLKGNRVLFALLLSLTILAFLMVVGTIWEFEMERLVTETRAVQTIFNTLLGGTILFVSVVLSINTAALSQEFEPLPVKLSQIEESIAFQVELEGLVADGVSPVGLKTFLTFVIGAIRAEAESLRATAERVDSNDLRSDFEDFADDIETQLSSMQERLERRNPRLSVILLSGLDYPYAAHINTARRLRVEHGSSLSESDREMLDSLVRVLTVFASGREYFATLYFKRELRNLSGNLLFLSLPVIVFTVYVLLAIDANLFPRAPIPGVRQRLFYVNIAFVVALSPYILLTSYIARIVTVSKHSLETTVFSI